MSSDKDKLECLAVLAELERYVRQDKLDSARIAKIAQWIINERKPEEFA